MPVPPPSGGPSTPRPLRPPRPSRIRRHGPALLAALLLAGLLWGLLRHGGLGGWATLDGALEVVGGLRERPLGPLWLVLLYVAGGFVMAPVMLLVAATAIALGPLWGIPTAMAGALASAAALFWVGRCLGRGPVERYGGPLVRRVSKRLGASGVFAVAGLRAVPVAPFTVVNLVAGASRIRFLDYLIGTMLGMAPGILAFNLLGHQLERTLRAPTAADTALLAGLAAVALGLGWIGNTLMSRMKGSRKP